MLGIKVLFYKGWEFFWRQALIARTISSYYILKCKYEGILWLSTYFVGKREFSYCTGKFLGLLYQRIANFNISINYNL